MLAITDQLRSWVEINSGSYNVPGLHKMCQVLCQDLQVLDAEINTITLPAFQHVNAQGQIEDI